MRGARVRAAALNPSRLGRVFARLARGRRGGRHAGARAAAAAHVLASLPAGPPAPPEQGEARLYFGCRHEAQVGLLSVATVSRP